MRRLLPVVVVVVGALTLGACGEPVVEDRRATVASRGAQVMPFDLAKTTHHFTKTDDGGEQVVTANDPTDQEQLALIRSHLRDEQARFSRGDYDDPARIHGMDMPGVSELAAGYQRIEVTYTTEPAGARLVYRTTDPALVDALHRWFDRQLMDHGDHARPD